MNSQRPEGAKRSTSSSASVRIEGRSASTDRGVNARLTSLRRRVWSSPSTDRRARDSISNNGPSWQSLQPHDRQEGAVETRVGEQGLHVLVRNRPPLPIGVRARQLLLPDRVRRGARVGFELGRQEVEQRRVGEGFHGGKYRIVRRGAQGPLSPRRRARDQPPSSARSNAARSRGSKGGLGGVSSSRSAR